MKPQVSNALHQVGFLICSRWTLHVGSALVATWHVALLRQMRPLFRDPRHFLKLLFSWSAQTWWCTMDSGVFCHEIDDWPCIKVSEESSTCNCTRYWRDMHREELLPEWITPQQNHLPLLFLYRDGGMWVRKCQFLRITTDYPAKSTGIKPPWPRSWSLCWQMLRLGEGNSLYGLSYPSGLFIIKFIHLWGSVAINNKRNYHLRNHTKPVTVVGDDG